MKPEKIILDCDPGHDDALALTMAVASEQIELLGEQRRLVIKRQIKR